METGMKGLLGLTGTGAPAAASTSGTGGLSSNGLSAPTNPGAAVQDIGKAGRGVKRITLQPVQAPPTAPTVAAPGPGARQPKRSLEDLMGGAGGVTTIGFRGLGGIGTAAFGAAKAGSGVLPEAVESSKLRLTPVTDKLAKRLKVEGQPDGPAADAAAAAVQPPPAPAPASVPAPAGGDGQEQAPAPEAGGAAME